MDARDLEIVRPCPIDLDARGVERGQRVVFCDHCQTEVHDLSTMTRAEASAFVEARRGDGVCVSYLRAPDGEIRFAEDRRSTGSPGREPSLIPIARLRAAAAALALAACTPHSSSGSAQVIDDAGDELVVDRSAPVIPAALPSLEPATPTHASPSAAPPAPEATPCPSPKVERRRGGIRPRARRDLELERVDGFIDI